MLRERLQLHRVRNMLRRLGYEIVRTNEPGFLGLHLSLLFEQLGINCVLDVGARNGEFGMWLRHNGYAGRIISFEPVSQSFEELRARSHGDPQWMVHRMALGSEEAERSINVTNFSVFSSFLEPNDYARDEFGSASQVQRTETVKIRRLDAVWNDVVGADGANRVYLKMDTQGWDLEVLRGAQGCLPSVLALQSEVSVQPIYSGIPTMSESLAEIESCGFCLSGMFPVNVDSSLRVVEFDCVAVRVDDDITSVHPPT